MSTKEIAIRSIQELPEDATWDDVQERINFIADRVGDLTYPGIQDIVNSFVDGFKEVVSPAAFRSAPIRIVVVAALGETFRMRHETENPTVFVLEPGDGAHASVEIGLIGQRHVSLGKVVFRRFLGDGDREGGLSDDPT